MKTKFTNSNKDNIALSTLLAAGLFFLASGVVSGNPAVTSHVAQADVQKLETVVVTASRAPDARLDTILVTAPRVSPHA